MSFDAIGYILAKLDRLEARQEATDKAVAELALWKASFSRGLQHWPYILVPGAIAAANLAPEATVRAFVAALQIGGN